MRRECVSSPARNGGKENARRRGLASYGIVFAVIPGTTGGGKGVGGGGPGGCNCESAPWQQAKKMGCGLNKRRRKSFSIHLVPVTNIQQEE